MTNLSKKYQDEIEACLGRAHGCLQAGELKKATAFVNRARGVLWAREQISGREESLVRTVYNVERKVNRAVDTRRGLVLKALDYAIEELDDKLSKEREADYDAESRGEMQHELKGFETLRVHLIAGGAL